MKCDALSIKKAMTGFLWSFVFCTLLIGCSGPSTKGPAKIEIHKECPLCGMYPARYPMFHCQIVFKDGTYEAFDSAAGLLVYLYFPDKTGFEVKEYDAIYFKDYVRELWIESETTFFVIGSEVLGPMGIEFLPADSEEAAKKLAKIEKGAKIIHFKNVDRSFMVKAAESGWLHMLANKLVLE
jgi:copper chaperone NosL